MRNDLGAEGGWNDFTEGGETLLEEPCEPNVFGSALSPLRMDGDENCESRNDPLLDAYLESLKPPPCAYELPE